MQRVAARGKDPRLERVALDPQRVENVARLFLDDLHHRVGRAFERKRGKIRDRLAAIIVPLRDRDRPTGILFRPRIGHIDIPRPAVEGDRAVRFIELDRAETGRKGVERFARQRMLHLGVGRRGASYPVAQSVQMLSGVGGRSRQTVVAGCFGRPPAEIKIGDRRDAERIARIAVRIDSVMKHGPEMLIPRNVYRKGLADFSECPVATALRPAVAIQIGC